MGEVIFGIDFKAKTADTNLTISGEEIAQSPIGCRNQSQPYDNAPCDMPPESGDCA